MTRNAALAALILGVSVSLSGVGAFADTSITAAGSTALLPLVKDAAGVYQQQNPSVKISVSGGGSGTGINQVAAKAVDIGDSDIVAANHPELHDNKVCVVGFAMIAHPGNGVKSLSKKQIQDIYAGRVSNWKEVGGTDLKMVVINRTRGSGTRVVFEKTVIAPDKVAEGGLSEDATGTVVSVVKQTPGSISYSSFAGVKGQTGVQEIAIDNVQPDEANVITGKYPFWSYEHMFTNGAPSGEVDKFIKFVAGNTDLIKKNGYIKLSDMKVTENDR